MALKAKSVYRDLGFKKKLAEIKALADKNEVAVGITGDKATENVDGDFRMVDLAAVHEYGSLDDRIPERAPIRTGILLGRKKIKAATELLLTKAVEGSLTVEQAQQQIGEVAVAEIRNAIRKRLPPPNTPETIRRKGSSVPLIDKGRLIASYTSVVRPKKK